ncbi:MULE domain-containing protein, partial [Aphis craccivora]
SEYLNNDSEVGKWMECFFGLSYLPPDEVSDGFCDLIKLHNNITLWACEPTNNPKTTNGAESYHKQYNSQFYTTHSHIPTSNNRRHYWNSK